VTASSYSPISLQSERRKKMNQYQMANTLMHSWKILGAENQEFIIDFSKLSSLIFCSGIRSFEKVTNFYKV
jgi:hypothetical protein